MRLNRLCELVLEDDPDIPVIVRALFGDRAGQGFGVGTGRAEGVLAGQVRWANFPGLREDGVFLPELRGVVETTAGSVLFQLSGLSLTPDEHERRRVIGSVRFFTDVEPLRWLNDSVAVNEGWLDTGSGAIRLPVSLCVPDDLDALAR